MESRTLRSAAFAAMAAVVVFPAATQAAPITYANQVLSNNPLLYYRLGESSGTVMTNSGTNATSPGSAGNATYMVGTSPNNTPITLGAPGYGTGDTAGKFNNTTSETSANDWGDVPVAAYSSINFNSATYEFVFKDSLTTDTGQLLAWGGGTGSQSGASIELNTSQSGTPADSIRFYTRNTNSTEVVNSSMTDATIFDGYYHLLDFTDNNGTIKMYVDGVAQTVTYTNGPTAVTYAAPTVDGVIGANAGGVNPGTSGTMDEVAIFSGVLSQSQITADYNALVATPEPSSLCLLVLGGAALLARRRRAT